MFRSQSNIVALLVTIIFPLKSIAAIDQYSYAVKGGISLGSYEAGLNWVLVENVRALQKQGRAELNAFAGASAGSINGLLSALRYCQADDESIDTSKNFYENNSFAQAWNIGIREFAPLPDQKTVPETFYNDIIEDLDLLLHTDQVPQEGVDRGGIFSRRGLIKSIKLFKKLASDPTVRYRENCQVKLAFSLTKLVPDKTLIANIDVLNQRYVIPILVRVKNGKIVFTNYHAEDDDFNARDSFIYLPEGGKTVDLTNIIKAVLASSAYPGAFAPVNLSYCKRDVSVSREHQVDCPPGYARRTDLFIDGGSFDNAPIGTALTLSDLSGRFENAIFEYINPGKLRRQSSERYQATHADEAIKRIGSNRYIAGISDIVGLSFYIMDYGMSAELYQTAKRIETLRRERQSDRPVINITDRFYPVVGDYLDHFGAFFDEQFRRFDFIAGLYDGIMHIAKAECKNATQQGVEYNECVAYKSKRIVEQLGLVSTPEFELIKHLAQREFGWATKSVAWQWTNSDAQIVNAQAQTLLAIFYALDLNACTRATICDQEIVLAGFDDFLRRLSELSPTLDGFEPYTRKMITNTSDWHTPLLNTALNRVYELEQKKYDLIDERDEDKKIQKYIVKSMKLGTFVGKTLLEKKETGFWPNTSVSHDWLSPYSLVPHEFGITYRQPSIYFKYRAEYHIPAGVFGNYGLELSGYPLYIVSRTVQVPHYMGADIVFKWHTDDLLFSMFGVGFGYYNIEIYDVHNRDMSDPKQLLHSFTHPLLAYILDSGYLGGKVRLSFIYRGDWLNNDTRGYVNWMFNLGIADIKGLKWLF